MQKLAEKAPFQTEIKPTRHRVRLTSAGSMARCNRATVSTGTRISAHIYIYTYIY